MDETIVNEYNVNPHFQRPAEFGLASETHVEVTLDAGIPVIGVCDGEYYSRRSFAPVVSNLVDNTAR